MPSPTVPDEMGDIGGRPMGGLARFSTTIAAAGLAVLTAGAAGAADIKVKAPVYKAPAPVVVYDWSGCYAGGNAGWIGGGDQFDLTPSGAFDLPVNVFSIAANRAPLLSSYRSHTSAFTGGLQIGCNRQFGGLVVGVEADFNFSSLNEDIVANYPLSPVIGQTRGANARTEHVTKRLDWYSTFRARAGYASDRLMIYATGGLAVARLDTSTDVLFDGNAVTGVLANAHFAGSADLTRWGYAVGAGAEYGFSSNWTVKAEYLYLDFGSFSHVLPDATGTAPTFSWTNNMRFHEHVVRIGANYRFGAPVVFAKY
jgi:outer membrane immunogenic protein